MTRDQPAPRDLITASPDELATHGIRYKSDDLFTGDSIATAGARIHFGLARLTPATQPFWRHYRASAAALAEVLNRLAIALARPEQRLDLNALAEEHGWTRARFDRIARTIRRRAYGPKKIFRRVKAGVTGVEWLLDEDFAPTGDRFVAYTAREPIVPEHPDGPLDAEAPTAELIRQHRARYSALLLTVGVATEPALPTVTHFGIFRNPSAFLDPNPVHRRLAMPLHGFAAAVSLHALSGKVYMITNPMPRMAEILRRSIDPQDLYVGDSEESVRAYLTRNLPPGTPPIAKDQRISFAGFTLKSRPTLVRLEALARHYLPAAG